MPAQPRCCGLPLGFPKARGGPNTFDGTSGGPKTDGLPTSPIRPESSDPPDPEPGAEFISGGPWDLHTCALTREPSHDLLKPVRRDNPPTATEKPMTKIFGGQTEFTEENMDTNPWGRKFDFGLSP
ncbi:hypothetical protein DB88DRAFT_475608 [Papiliotrema laurentii]|uniref:Uncharacterized protein n=1 Tax=Papiliotrema laurentii TaxID=5418 RepID=A0AAD9CUH6_PAPLA|nr:hypothetical protein DB88DRAFT_475608 [Papiliotrema laurentii]